MSENELLPYTVLKPISHKGDRIEKGSVLHLTSQEAENIGSEYLEPAEKAEEKEIPAEPSSEKKEEDESTEDSENESGEEEKDSSADGTQDDNNEE